MRWLLIVALSSAAGATSAAQTPTPTAPRAIELPDTLGANFSIADSATKAGTPTDFDFLIGLWEFRFQSRRPDGSFYPVWVGHWFVQKKQSRNAFVEDHFRPDDEASTYDVGTWTYRVFNPSRRLWEMEGVNSEAGAWSPGLCWSDARNRYLVQRYGSAIMRIRYLAITENSFLWRADRSVDGGKTWIADWWTMKGTRISK